MRSPLPPASPSPLSFSVTNGLVPASWLSEAARRSIASCPFAEIEFRVIVFPVDPDTTRTPAPTSLVMTLRSTMLPPPPSWTPDVKAPAIPALVIVLLTIVFPPLPPWVLMFSPLCCVIRLPRIVKLPEFAEVMSIPFPKR